MTEQPRGVQNRHLAGAGVAVCAVCCAPPLLALIGIAGTGALATVATLAFAGLAFGMVVLLATVAAVWWRRHQVQTASVSCSAGTSETESCTCCSTDSAVLTVGEKRDS
jgi:hypothetical protein